MEQDDKDNREVIYLDNEKELTHSRSRVFDSLDIEANNRKQLKPSVEEPLELEGTAPAYEICLPWYF